jgi:membrane protein required for colicin V production
MPFQLLDIILAGIMIISALLALMRGFTREVLSLIAWALAAGAAIFAVLNKDLVAMAGQYIEPPMVSLIALGGAAFLVVLIIASLISVKISDTVVDSSAGAFDRSLGFIYGLGRGLVLVTIAYIFYSFLTPIESQQPWIKNARSLPVIDRVADVIKSLVPEEVANQLSNLGIRTNPEKPAPKPGQGETEGTADPNDTGYSSDTRNQVDQVIQGTDGADGQAQEKKPEFGGDSGQN